MPKPTTFSEAVPVIVDLADKQYDLVHGDENTVVETDNGPVPSAAKAVADLNAAYAAQDVVVVSAAARDEAQAAAVTASAAAQASLTNGQKYATVAEGHDATADGGYFDVIGDNVTTAVIRYQRTSSTTDVIVTESPAKALVDGITDAIEDTGVADALLQVTDPDGFAGLLVSLLGDLSTPAVKVMANRIENAVAAMFSDATLSSGQLKLVDGDGFSLLEVLSGTSSGLKASLVDVVFGFDSASLNVFDVRDLDGFIGFQVSKNGLPIASAATSSVDVAINKRNIANLALSYSIRSTIGGQWTPLLWAYCLFIWYGQSFSNGSQSIVPLSKVGKYSNKMLGQGPRPTSPTDPAFVPLGDSALHDLIEISQGSDGLTTSARYFGESSMSGALNGLKRFHNDRLQVDNDTTRTFVGTEPGVGGMTIDQLAKGATPNLYQRYLDVLTLIKAAIGSATAGVAAIMWKQGENDASMARAMYYAKLLSMQQTMVADALAAFPAQTRPPAFFLYQMGGTYTSDAAQLGVQMAQLDLVNQNKNCFMVGPVYPYPDPGAHLFANSYRWYGWMIAKVMYRVLELGQRWRPMQVLSATSVAGSLAIYIDIFVPVPPLQFGTPYDGATVMDYVDKGFKVTDGLGTLSGANLVATIVADTVIKLTASRALSGAAYLWYADKTVHNGNGCVMDSDDTPCDDVWVYDAASGQPAAENIAALLGKPYALNNWLTASYTPITIS